MSEKKKKGKTKGPLVSCFGSSLCDYEGTRQQQSEMSEMSEMSPKASFASAYHVQRRAANDVKN